MFFSECMVKQTVVHPDYGVLLSNKKKWSTDISNNLDENCKLCRVKKAMSKSYVLYDPIYKTFLKSPKYRDGEQMVVGGEGRGTGWQEGQEGCGCGYKRATRRRLVCADWGNCLYLYCGGGYMHLHVIKLRRIEYMHTRVRTQAVSQRLRLSQAHGWRFSYWFLVQRELGLEGEGWAKILPLPSHGWGGRAGSLISLGVVSPKSWAFRAAWRSQWPPASSKDRMHWGFQVLICLA